jgi:hypothetical protein
MYNENHVWSFSTIGGVKRVNLESGKDLMALGQLDQKLWTALSCPVHGLEIDPVTLSLIDSDHDGQIRVPEVLAAVKWITSMIHNPDDLLKQEATFPLSAINEQTEEGKALLASAEIILNNLNKSGSSYLTVDETSDTIKIFAGSKFNGDGIITEDSTESAELKELINNIMLCLGSSADRGGKNGISQTHLDTFYEQCTLYNTWYTKAENNSKDILPFGSLTEKAFETFLTIKAKIDDYFLRCRLAAFDVEATNILNLLTNRVETISAKDLSTCLDEIAAYPLAKIEAQKPLPLKQGINPAWETSINDFLSQIVIPTFPQQEHITEHDWRHITSLFVSYEDWQLEKNGVDVEQLGIERIRTILTNNRQQQLSELIAQDIDLADEAESIIRVDQLVRYYRDIFTLLKNFVTFSDFYFEKNKAIFLAGTLYIDQRSCDLCIKVNNMDKHNGMVGHSGMYLLYCECTSKANDEKMIIASALTNGDIDNLEVGRNALFYDRNGKDWDATIIKIVENPISIRQAFWSPYRKVSRFIETQIHKFASAEDGKSEASLQKGITDIPAKAETQPKQPPTPFDIGKFVGIFAAISLALGAIGTVLASIFSGFLGLIWWQMPLAIAGLMLFISGPSMIMAFLKLRKRNLAPILDANGWAINARAVVNITFGNTLTHLAQLPKGAKINLNDPFTKKKIPIWQIIFLITLVILLVSFILWKVVFSNVSL